MDYEDFEIEIRQRLGGGYELRVLSPPSRRADSRFVPPYEESEIDSVLNALEARVWRSGGQTRELVRSGGGQVELHRDSPEQIGTKLFNALCAGDIKDVFHRSMGVAEERTNNGRPTGLRLRLTFDRGEDFAPLAALPWELLRHGEEYLGPRRHFPLVRFLPGTETRGPLKVEGKLKVLLVVSDPKDLTRLDHRKEVDAIRKALKRQVGVSVEEYFHPNIEGLRTRLLDGSFHILHFIGHGWFPKTNGAKRGGDEGVLFFEDENGCAQRVAGPELANFLLDLPLRLVFLNACQTAAFPRSRGQDPYRGVAAALASRGLPAVVAMQFPISDRAAIEFSDTFYSRLAAGDPVDTAVMEGRLAISKLESLEWVTPVLFLSSEDGTLFVSTPREAGEVVSTATSATTSGAETAGAERPSPSDRDEPLHLGVRSFAGWGDLEKQSHHLLSLTDLFNGRHIREPRLWDGEVFPRLREFLLSHAVPGGRPVVLDFAAHLSLAFAAGYCLEAKSGLDLTIIQRGQQGPGKKWITEAGATPDDALWKQEEDRYPTPPSWWGRLAKIRWVFGGSRVERTGSGAHDVAFAVGVTWPVADDVEEYLKREKVRVGRLVEANLHPAPSPTGVRDGLHALQLAQRLSLDIRRRSVQERKGTLHLFLSAPNAFTFYLGQLARSFGQVQLYEHDFEAKMPGAYLPSMTFPPPALEVGPRED